MAEIEAWDNAMAADLQILTMCWSNSAPASTACSLASGTGMLAFRLLGLLAP
jgi:hypothetical protein